jgi:hypothetical protein
MDVRGAIWFGFELKLYLFGFTLETLKRTSSTPNVIPGKYLEFQNTS